MKSLKYKNLNYNTYNGYEVYRQATHNVNWIDDPDWALVSSILWDNKPRTYNQ